MYLQDTLTDPFAAAEPDLDALAALLDGCANPGVSRHAVLLRLTALPASATRPHGLRLVAQAIDPLLGLDRARLFRLPDGNLVLVWRGAASAIMHRASAALAGLIEDAGGRPDRVFAALELPRDTHAIRQAIHAATRVTKADATQPGHPLDPATLARLEGSLAQADVAHFSRRRPICRWPEGKPATLAWEKRFLSVADLAATLAPDIHPQSDPWLFRRLTRTLDRRMLALLSDPAELRDAGPFALDINVASILGPEFLRFDAALPPHLRGEVVLNLLPADILGDAGAFEFARDFARARGYRMLLRKLTIGWLTVLPADLLGVDLIQLRATPDLIASMTFPSTLDPTRVVLSEVATRAALDWSRRHGVTLLEGPLMT